MFFGVSAIEMWKAASVTRAGWAARGCGVGEGSGCEGSGGGVGCGAGPIDSVHSGLPIWVSKVAGISIQLFGYLKLTPWPLNVFGG